MSSQDPSDHPEEKPLTVGITLNVPFIGLRPLIEELTALLPHALPDSVSRNLLESVIEHFKKTRAEVEPSIEAFRSQVKTAAHHAAFFAAQAAEAGRDTAPIIQGIAQTIQELAAETDEELMRRSREIGPLMNRLNEFIED